MSSTGFSTEKFGSAASAAEAVAVRILEQISDSSGPFRLAIPGGRSPVLIFQRLAEFLMDAGPEDREKLRLFWVDERAVAPDKPENNYRLAMEYFAELNLRSEQIFRIRGELGAKEAAARYADQLRAELDGGAFDFALLGMGTDGHIASIFPRDPRAEGEAPLAYAAAAPVAPRERITVSIDLLNRSRKGILLTLGEEKSVAFASLQAGEQRLSLPASFLDKAVFTIVCDRACFGSDH